MGDESLYYKQIALEGRVFLKSSPVRSSAIHCALRKCCFCKVGLIIGTVNLVTGGKTPPLRDV